MVQELVNLIAETMWNAVGLMPELFGLILMGILFFFMAKNKVDRGGLALLSMLALGFMARPISEGGFGMIPPWIFYVVVVAVAVISALGFINIQREG